MPDHFQIGHDTTAPVEQSQASFLGYKCSPEEVVLAYHEQTKHHLNQYAASLGYMDWSTQPNPFRRYSGAPLVRLPLALDERILPYWQLYVSNSVEPVSLSIDSISQFFRYALSLTAWKRYEETTWSLRANPSSGNLHPTEGYAVLPAIVGLHDQPGVYHYAPREHGLERRVELDQSVWTNLMAAFPASSFLVGLSSIYWREAWKYGERAFRYCQHDVGHALGTLRFASASLGWTCRLLDHMGDAVAAQLLGLDRPTDYTGAEREQPEFVALVAPVNGLKPRRLRLPVEAVRHVSAAKWRGVANSLSSDHNVDWPVIDDVAAATTNATSVAEEDFSTFPSEKEVFETLVRSGRLTAERVILGRRSAVNMDASTAISAATFFRMLARTVPVRESRSIPWDALPWRPRIHLAVFVHRVSDLPSGLYVLVRDPEKVAELRQTMSGDFLWSHPPSCPRQLPLFLLKEGDCRDQARAVSCGQNIAGDGAFSLGMIADFMSGLRRFGAGFYRNLFWEAGLVGQVLYLEAEEAGIRSTGIGCYFDDEVHRVFGISSHDWQSFYHFTVGAPVEDRRLTTLPAYSS